jgi:transposase-like protein
MEIVRSLLPYLTVKLDQVAEAVAIRTEYVELLKERKRFCKRGHDLKDTAYPNNQTRANCRECNRTRQAEWRSAQKGG